MSENQTYPIEQRLHLSQGTLAAIRQLMEACEAVEPAPVRFSWSMVQSRPGLMPLDFCASLDGLLVGYLWMDHYDPQERETCILVHPAYRRRGIGLALLAKAREACQQAGIEHMVLLCEQRAISGKAFVKHVGARVEFAEHEMALGDYHPRPIRASPLRLRLATRDDLDALASLQASSFAKNEDRIRQRLLQYWQDQSSRQYIALPTAGQSDTAEPIGMVRLSVEDHETGLYGLSVAPAYQRRGYGRQIVEEAICIARSNDPKEAIMLDVDVTNSRAFNLYLSCGFQVRATYNYYHLGVRKS